MKYAVVTGSTKGIGRAISEKLLREGYFTFVNFAADVPAAERFVQENHCYSDQIHLIQKSLDSFENVRQFVCEILKVTQKIDCLVLNAGVTDRSSLAAIQPEEWEKVMAVNVNAPLYLVQACSSYLVEGGRVIFIGSILGEYPHGTSLSYSVTKAAIHQMARCLVKEFAQRSITVNVIAPGFINTPWQKNKDPQIRKNICNKTALKRFGEPEEVAELCWQIVTNGFLNGAVIHLDGGYSYR